MRRTSALKISSPVKELFFIIAPPRHIMSDVSVLKDDVHYLIGHEFDDRYSQFKPFNVFIKNLNVFHNGSNRTIYMDIVNKYPVRDIFEKLIKEESGYTPHITIAKKLSPEDFLKAWPYLKDFSYSQHFLCDRITVLARAENRWIHYKDIMFGEY